MQNPLLIGATFPHTTAGLVLICTHNRVSRARNAVKEVEVTGDSADSTAKNGAPEEEEKILCFPQLFSNLLYITILVTGSSFPSLFVLVSLIQKVSSPY